MAIEIKVPQLPESVADATLVTWHKQAGQAVSRDENLADLETDKVVLEVPAPVNGVLKELKIVAGTSVTSGQVLAVLEEGAAAAAAPAPKAAAPGGRPRKLCGPKNCRYRGYASSAPPTTAATPVLRSTGASAARCAGQVSAAYASRKTALASAV